MLVVPCCDIENITNSQSCTLVREAPSGWAQGGTAGSRGSIVSQLVEERLIESLPPNFNLPVLPAQRDGNFAD